MLNVERLRSLLQYSPDTGTFRWQARRASNAAAGEIAGTTHNAGYWRISIDGETYLAHRLAWLYVHGRWPAHEVDHINMDRTDNRIANLREATSQQNKLNSGCRQNNKASGLKGVVHRPNRKRPWEAYIRVAGRKTFLGCFSTAQEAAGAYAAASLKHFGEFGRAGLSARPCKSEIERGRGR